MRALLTTYGSRGDVEPIAGLGAALEALGVDARVCAPPDQEFVEVLERAGVDLVPAFTTVREWASRALQNRDAFDLPAFAAEMVARQYEIMAEAAEGCDVILASGLLPSCAAARIVAEQRGLPYVFATFAPMWLPSEHHAPTGYPGAPLPEGETDNRVLWEAHVGAVEKTFGPGVRALRERLGLPPVENLRRWVFTDRPWLASDPAIWPWRVTSLCEAVQTGAWFLPDRRPLERDLQAFLAAGEPPVYVGFGSMPMQAAKDAAAAALGAARALGKRVILLKGWAGLEGTDDREACFLTGDVNQQALFPRVAAVVHHGGAGTTQAAALCGAPQVVAPQIADQPSWGERVAKLGIGASTGPAPTVEAFARALSLALASDTGDRAAAIAGQMRTDGAATAAGLLVEVARGAR